MNLGAFLGPSLLVTGPILLVVALGLTFVVRARLPDTSRRVLFFLTAMSVGGILQVTLLREPPIGSCLVCLTQWRVDRLVSGQLGVDAALNVVLFVPFGLFATLLWRRPGRVIGVGALISLVVEVIQPVLGSGANDLTDIVTNTVGAAIGAGAAMVILLVRDTIATRRLDVRRCVALVGTIVLAVGVAVGISIGGATIIASDGARQLDTMFAGTTRADHQHQEDAWATRIEAFWRANHMPIADAYSDDRVALQRFTWTFYWTTRCVIARWDADGFTTEVAAGGRCGQRLDQLSPAALEAR